MMKQTWWEACPVEGKQEKEKKTGTIENGREEGTKMKRKRKDPGI